MDLKQLNTFVQVAELGSLSKASSRLRIAQPALSRQMRMLEQELNVTLFARHGRGMMLTEAGTFLLARASAILHQIEETRADLIQQDEQIRGNVTLGVPPTVGDVLAARLAQRFVTQYPEVTLRIIPAFTGYLLDFLHRGEMDLAVMYATDQRLNLRITPLIVENLFLVAHADEALSVHHAVTFESIATRRLVLPGPQHGLRVLIEKEARRYGVHLDIPVEADALQTLKDLVYRRMGATILPFASVYNDVVAGRLSVAPVIEPHLSRKLILAQPLGKPVSNAVQRFAQALEAEVAEMVESKIWDGQLLRPAIKSGHS